MLAELSSELQRKMLHVLARHCGWSSLAIFAMSCKAIQQNIYVEAMDIRCKKKPKLRVGVYLDRNHNRMYRAYWLVRQCDCAQNNSLCVVAQIGPKHVVMTTDSHRELFSPPIVT